MTQPQEIHKKLQRRLIIEMDYMVSLSKNYRDEQRCFFVYAKRKVSSDCNKVQEVIIKTKRGSKKGYICSMYEDSPKLDIRDYDNTHWHTRPSEKTIEQYKKNQKEYLESKGKSELNKVFLSIIKNNVIPENNIIEGLMKYHPDTERFNATKRFKNC